MGPNYQALPCLRRCSWLVLSVRWRIVFFCPDALPCVRRCSRWVPAVRGANVFFLFFAWTHFLAWEDVAGGSQQSGGNVFSRNTVARPVGPHVRWRNNYFARNKEALPCCAHGPSCQPLHVQSTSDGSRSLTTLTRPRREHQGGGRPRGLGMERHEGS